MKLTRHNGRSGRKGTYNPKHNDRRFDVNNSEHIDEMDGWENVYWDCYQGFHYGYEREDAAADFHSFEDVEKVFYFEQYNKYCEAQHERNRSRGHPERNRSTEDLRMDKKTCPEETIIQMGTMESSISRKYLKEIAIEYFEEFTRRFGEHVHILNWSLHVDEATPHIHERHVFDCENRYGEIAPQQEKALEALEIPLPYPDRKPGRNNNRKMKFDSICRVMLLDIAKKHGIYLDENPEYGGREYLEKQEYILMKQNRIIAERKAAIDAEEEKLTGRKAAVAEKEKELAALEAKIRDTEAFIEEVTDTAYKEAVNMISEEAAEEAKNMFFDEVSQFREDMLKNDDLSIGVREYLYQTLEPLLDRFRGLTKHITDQIRYLFSEPVKKEKFRQIVQESRWKYFVGDRSGHSINGQVEDAPGKRRGSR